MLWAAARWAGEGVRFSPFRLDTVSAEARDEQRFAVGAPAKLIVDSEGGNVTVTAGETSEIVVKIHKTAWGANQAEAEAALADLNVSVTQSGDTVTARYDRPSEIMVVGSTRGSTVNFEILVPEETAVTAGTRFGDVNVSGVTGEAGLETSFGAVEAADITGALTAESSSGDITARRIQAGSDLIDLKTSFGRVTLVGAQAGQVTVHSSSGALQLTDVRVEDDLKADTDFGSVTLEQVEAAAYDLDSNSGDMTVAGASGALSVHTDFGAIAVTEAQTVTLDLKTNSGNVAFAGSLGEGSHTVRTEFGTVRLALPEASAFTADLKTSFGKITSAFALTLSGEMELTHLQGDVNGGGETLTVETNSGDIKLEFLTP